MTAPHSSLDHPIGAVNRGHNPPYSVEVLVFYAKPLIRKWLKYIKSPAMAIISEDTMPPEPWARAFKAKSVSTMTWADWQADDAEAQYDGVVWFQLDASPQQLPLVEAKLKRGGALLVITRNVHAQWGDWQTAMVANRLLDPFAVGFHPMGAVFWWPANTPGLIWLGKVFDNLAMFFPGRYPMGLRFAPWRVFRAFKRDDQTVLD